MKYRLIYKNYPKECVDKLDDKEKLAVELRLMGWGFWHIGRVLYDDEIRGGMLTPSGARYRAEKIYRRAIARLEACRRQVCIGSESVERVSVNTGTASADFIGSEPEEESFEAKMYPYRLGRTQKMVIVALEALGGCAQLATIHREILRLYGLDATNLTRNAVWQALRRLVARGIVVGRAGFYCLRYSSYSPKIPRLPFAHRVYGKVPRKVLWSEKEVGRPIDLLSLSKIGLSRGYRVVEAELQDLVCDEELAEKARSLWNKGWRYTKVYLTDKGCIRVEHYFDRLELSPWGLLEARKMYREALALSLHVIERITKLV